MPSSQEMDQDFKSILQLGGPAKMSKPNIGVT